MQVPFGHEGYVAHPRDGTLHVGEEDARIWRVSPSASAGEIVAMVDNARLIADIARLALVQEGAEGSWLVASSPGDNAYAVFYLPMATGLFIAQDGENPGGARKLRMMRREEILAALESK